MEFLKVSEDLEHTFVLDADGKKVAVRDEDGKIIKGKFETAAVPAAGGVEVHESTQLFPVPTKELFAQALQAFDGRAIEMAGYTGGRFVVRVRKEGS